MDYKLKTKKLFTMFTNSGTITSSLTRMPQDTCQTFKQIEDTKVIKHEPRISYPDEICKLLKISAPKGTGAQKEDLLTAFSLIESIYSYNPSEMPVF